MRFTKDMGSFQVEIEIQSQRYYKEERTGNFRVNCFLFCREFTELSGKKLSFTSRSITEGKSSWIKINPQTDIERLKSWFLCKLDSILNKLENKYSIEYLLDIWPRYNTGLQYLFLLAKNNPEQLDEWADEMELGIQKLDVKLLKLSSGKSEQEKRDDCLDEEMRSDDIRMKINRLVSSKKNILETLDFIQSNTNKIEITV